MTRSLQTSIVCASLGAAIALAVAPARGDDTGKVAQASSFFDAGEQAYKAGQYQVAAEAFLKAHELLPSPALLFSAAQAYRRHHLTERSADSLRRAIALYRDYLRAEVKPKRREDALQALEALVPLVPSDSGAPRDTPAPKDGDAAPAAPVRATRLLLSARSDGAEASVDGGPFVAMPAVVKVEPGPHKVVVRAPGYHDVELSVPAVANELIPRLVALRPKAALLRVTGTAGARVAIDGQPRATLPADAPIAIEPGSHFVGVTLAGHEPYGKLIDLERDSTVDLAIRLPMTSQRIAAWSILSAGFAGVVAGGVLTGLTLAREGEAVALRDQRAKTPLTPDERDRYNSAVTARNDLARAAAITGGAAGVLLAVGAGLHGLDRPEAPAPVERRKAPSDSPRAEFDVGFLSIGVRGVF